MYGTLSVTVHAQIFIVASLSEPHTIVVYGTTCIDRPTDRPINRPTDRVRPIHVILIRCTCSRCQAAMPHSHVRHVNSAVRSGDSYKTENADDGKAKSRDTRATNCEAGTRDQRTSSYLRFLVGVAMHPWVFTYVSFSRWLLHTNPFSHSYISTTHAHCILDKTYGHVMHTGMHRPHPLA